MFGFFSKSGSKSKQAAAPAPGLKVEALEDRLTPASVSVAYGQLWVYGTDYGDTITIERSSALAYTAGGSSVRQIKVYDNWVYIGGALESSLYNRDVIVYGYGGNDTITNNTALDLIAYGGWGYDKITGGSGNDFLVGEGDTDQLFGRDGNDTLIGNWYWNNWNDGGADYLQGDDWGRNWWVDDFTQQPGGGDTIADAASWDHVWQA